MISSQLQVVALVSEDGGNTSVIDENYKFIESAVEVDIAAPVYSYFRAYRHTCSLRYTGTFFRSSVFPFPVIFDCDID